MVLITTSFHLFGITPSICTPSLIRNFETAFAHPNRQKIFTPLPIPTGKAQMHTLFERKFLIPSLICNGKGCFLSLFAKFLFTCSHRASANYRVFLKSCPTSVPAQNLTVALPRSRRQKRQSSQGRIRSALFNCQVSFERTLH